MDGKTCEDTAHEICRFGVTASVPNPVATMPAHARKRRGGCSAWCFICSIFKNRSVRIIAEERISQEDQHGGSQMIRRSSFEVL